jgi:hypothetical protein
MAEPMYARISRFEGISVTPELAAQIEAVLKPILEALEGWQGTFQLLDESGTNAVTINFFDTAENMAAAEPIFEGLATRLESLSGQLGGSRTAVERYRVVSEMRPEAS